MREIKFRAWDEQLKLMLHDVVYMNTGHGYGKYSVVLPFKSENYFRAFGQRGWEIDDAGNAYKHNLKVMQYTGLKDKNGVEVYEGDIVKLIKGENLKVIVWDESDACFDWKDANNNSWPDNFTGFIDEYEVIGNIYENPELLGREE